MSNEIKTIKWLLEVCNQEKIRLNNMIEDGGFK